MSRRPAKKTEPPKRRPAAKAAQRGAPKRKAPAKRTKLRDVRASDFPATRSRLVSQRPGARRTEADFFNSQSYRRRERALERQDIRDLAAGNPIAKRVVDAMRTHIVGSGIIGRSDVSGTVDLGDGRGSIPMSRVYQERWDAWAEFGCDVHGRTLYQQQRDFWQAAFIDGDAALLLLSSGKTQLITADRIVSPSTPADEDKGRSIVDGVVVNDIGVPIAFYIRTADEEPQRYKARDVIFYVARRQHPDDVRGTPAFGATFDLFHQLNELLGAHLVSARASACISLVITQEGADDIVEGLRRSPRNPQSAYPSGEPPQEILQPGQILRLNKGEGAQGFIPTQPGQLLAMIIAEYLRLIGMAEGLSLEFIALDWTKLSWATARAAAAAFKKIALEWLDGFLPHLQRLYRWRISKWVKNGRLPAAPDAWRHTWTPPKWGSFDLIKDLQAYQMAIDGGFMGHKDVWDELQIDGFKMADHEAEVIAYFADRGIYLSRSTATRDPTATATAKPPTEPPADPLVPAQIRPDDVTEQAADEDEEPTDGADQ